MSAPRNKKEEPGASLCHAGVLAASILQEACKAGAEHGDPLMLKTVREAALNLGNQLGALAVYSGDGPLPPPLLAEGAARCADLANLAACALPSLSAARTAPAIAAMHLAAGIVRAFVALVGDSTNADEKDYVVRDARGAGWRAGLAVRQVEEQAEKEQRS